MSITNYLKKDSGVEFKAKEKIKSYEEYIADYIENTFKGIKLSKDEIHLLEHVICGQGQEKDKITSPYSSSLQSFLIFRKVSKENPIKINNIEYDKVDFEVKNPVINYPSSIDVKLSNDNRDVLFIESKLYEVVRDSKEYGIPVIGPSYFSDNKNGYSKKLRLNCAELRKIGVNFPPKLENEMYGKKDASEIKAGIIYETDNKDGYLTVEPIKNIKYEPIKKNKWVYSYGIKQILSHIIGILNYKGSPIKQRKFAYIYNKLPGYKESFAEDKIIDYYKHVDMVFDILKDKPGKDIEKSIITYQELYNEKANNKYFKQIGESVCKYYKLDQ